MSKDSNIAKQRISPSPLSTRTQLTVFIFLMVTQFVATLDNQIVATAMPTIVGDLGQAEHFSWVAYP